MPFDIKISELLLHFTQQKSIKFNCESKWGLKEYIRPGSTLRNFIDFVKFAYPYLDLEFYAVEIEDHLKKVRRHYERKRDLTDSKRKDILGFLDYVWNNWLKVDARYPSNLWSKYRVPPSDTTERLQFYSSTNNVAESINAMIVMV